MNGPVAAIHEGNTGTTNHTFTASLSAASASNTTFALGAVVATSAIVNDDIQGQVINGNAVDDFITGGIGSDTLTGGLGYDRFIDTATAKSPVGNTRDTISDFNTLLDKIDVAAIDANTTLANDQAFTFIGAADFSALGQVR